MDVAFYLKYQEIFEVLNEYYQISKKWEDKNALLKISLNKANTVFQQVPIRLFRNIIKYC